MLIVLTPSAPSSPSKRRAPRWKRRKRSVGALPLRSLRDRRKCRTKDETEGSDNKEEGEAKNCSVVQRSFNECYFVVKGAAIVLPHDECMHVYRKNRNNGAGDIQRHLQSMFYLLRSSDTLRMAVKLESVHAGRTRYLVVVSCVGRQDTEESCLLGVDCNVETTVGLVLPVWADTSITLDGDGGFSISSTGRHHIFKPVSVQAMWSALQTLHKASARAREYNYYAGGGTHQWIENYEKRIESDRSCLNEWHAMDDLVSRRPLSPDTVRSEPTERDNTEKLIRTKLKELMMSVDLDEVTSKYIRNRLEEELDMNLNEYKSFIDQEMLTILGQMDAPTEIFEYLYLGSEWNASNLEELKFNGVGHILNVTREIDNFFPGMFDYSNIRVYDDETTQMLQYWDKTYKYIAKVKNKGSKVLVHCKMGISRSASVVIAYVMKAYDWNLDKALEFVKNKRNCIKPNSGFLKQLEIYQGILDASKQRHNSLWRSKSETNLKSPEKPKKGRRKEEKKFRNCKKDECTYLVIPGGATRPKSWSPDDATADMLFSIQTPMREFHTDDYYKGNRKERYVRRYGTDLEFYNGAENKMMSAEECLQGSPKSDSDVTELALGAENGMAPGADGGIHRVSSIKDRINKLESQVHTLPAVSKVLKPEPINKCGLVLNLANHFECGNSKPGTPSPVDEGLTMKSVENSLEQDVQGVEPIVSQMKPPIAKHQAVLIKPGPWPDGSGEKSIPTDGTSQVSELESGRQQDENRSEAKENLMSSSLIHSFLEKNPDQLDGVASDNLMQKSFAPISNAVKSNALEINQDMNIHASKHSSHLGANILKKNSSVVEAPVSNVIHSDSFCYSGETKTTVNTCHVPHQISQMSVQYPLMQETVSSKCTCSEPVGIISQTKYVETSQITLSTDNCSPQNEIYNKEAIPWTPGTVLRTKQQLEEQNMKKTCDSSFPMLSQSTPSTPPEVCPETDETVKCVQRSNSLRSEHRPSSLYSGKYYPLPALAGPRPFKTPKGRVTSPEPNNRTGIIHSVSSPSVVEAVNDVICGTQEILNSAIQSLPSERCSVSLAGKTNTKLQSDIDILEFSNININNNYSTNQRTDKGLTDNPLPGTVKQQKELLENLHVKSMTGEEYKTSKEQMKLIKEYGKSLVSGIQSLETEEKDSGMVKRLTKELEAKSGSSSHKRERIVILNKDGEEIDAVPKGEDPCERISTSTPSSPTIDCRSRLCTVGCDAKFRSKPTFVSTHKYHVNSSDRVQAEDKQLPPPPAPHRKASLDLERLKIPLWGHSGRPSNRTVLPNSRLFPEMLANIQNLPKLPRSLSSNGLQKSMIQITRQLTRTTSSENVSNLEDVKMLSPAGSPPLLKSIPVSVPPPPPGPPRKVRKQQGKSHPLTKLSAKQRHANPLYNTM
ncbi:uncharacterized protein ssh isoform X1 [Centruroides vittatus]|uniref:uncharacterized protein ssh isoform X1 n=1 Tax=Centruroides vittatus TaxID=120091 RepID=UPI00350FCB64